LKLRSTAPSFLLGLAATSLAGALLLYRRPPVSGDGGLVAAPASVLGPELTRGRRFSALLEPVQKPVEVGAMGPWLVTLRDRAGQAARGCSLVLNAWMPAHGHGLPTEPRMTREFEQGVYQIDGMRFSMPGAWELRLLITGCGETDTAIFQLEL
jgi:hypothetical protein